MNKIYADAEEKNLMSVVVYAQADDGKIFHDEKFKNEVSKSELMNLLLKDLAIICYQNAYYKAANFADKTTHIEVNVEAETGWLTFKSAQVTE